jgi:hypothetical protein
MQKLSHMSAVGLLSATVLTGLPGGVRGDEAVAPGAGPWIRVTTRGHLQGIAKDDARLEGTLQHLDESGLVLGRGSDHEAVTIPRAAIVRVDTRLRASSRGKAAFIGGAVGLVAGVSIGLASGSDKNCSFIPSLCFSAGDKAAIYSLLTVPAGALLGLAIGHGSQWNKGVPLDHLRLSVGPAPGRGIAIAVTRVF